jgi:hypothetical protein
MPAWIHDRARHILAKNPDMPKSQAFGIATQQSHAAGKTPKGYGTAAGKTVAKAKYDRPKKEYKKTSNPGGLETPKLAAFADELQKIAWFGTYYHGTSPAAEKAVLREGLKASKGGVGGATQAAERATREFGLSQFQPLVEGFKKETAGRVSMSRSKALAKIYGMSLTPEIKRKVLAASKEGKTRAERVRSALKAVGRAYTAYQPLEISGKGLTGLRRDPSHYLLGVQTQKDVPAQMIRKAQPSRLGAAARRVLLRK